MASRIQPSSSAISCSKVGVGVGVGERKRKKERERESLTVGKHVVKQKQMDRKNGRERKGMKDRQASMRLISVRQSRAAAGTNFSAASRRPRQAAGGRQQGRLLTSLFRDPILQLAMRGARGGYMVDGGMRPSRVEASLEQQSFPHGQAQVCRYSIHQC